MNNQRLIYGDKLLDWLREPPTDDFIIYEIESGRFDLPSNQGEATRLRESMRQIAEYERDQYESPLHAYDNCKIIAREALSLHTEGTGIQKVRLADEEERKGGWTLSPKFLDEIQDKIEGHDDAPSWEGIELVLLAHYGLPIPGITDREGKQDV